MESLMLLSFLGLLLLIVFAIFYRDRKPNEYDKETIKLKLAMEQIKKEMNEPYDKQKMMQELLFDSGYVFMHPGNVYACTKEAIIHRNIWEKYIALYIKETHDIFHTLQEGGEVPEEYWKDKKEDNH